MQFNVSQLLREPVGATRDYDVTEEIEIEGEPLRLSGHVELIRTDRGVLVRARLAGAARAECCRCLAPVEGRSEVDLEEEYAQTVDAVSGAPLRSTVDPEAFRIDARHTLDLTDAVRQYWVLAQPMQPLCRPDCAGLCALCGRNRNDDPCDCEPVDERWTPLARLRGFGER